MICQFCKEEKKLCKAHLVPESFFRFMYPEGKIEGESLLKIVDGNHYTKRSRTGMYDKNILCSECDNELSGLDDYGKQIFIDTTPTPVQSTKKGAVFEFKGADAEKLKLFILSVFWRFSVSQLPEAEKVQLRGVFPDQLFSMLKNKDVGGIHDFSIVITRFEYKEPKGLLEKYFQSPIRNRIVGVNYLTFYLSNGYKILVKVDGRNQVDALIPLSLKVGCPVYILVYQLFEGALEYKKLLENVHKIKFHT